MWHICLGGSIAVLLVAVALSTTAARGKKSGALSPMNTFAIGVFLASTIMFLPVYAEMFEGDNLWVRCFKTVIISVHHTIRLFIVDSDFDIIRNLIHSRGSSFYSFYSCYAAVLFVLSPVLTFGVVLSFFKNASAYRRYLKSYNKNIYVFSRLNEKSLALGESILEKYNKAKIIYMAVEDRDETKEAHMPRAKALGAICFRDDILSVNFHFHSHEKKIAFFMIDENESDNVKQALNMIEKYKDRENTRLYVFSNGLEGEVLLSSVKTNALKLRRISNVRTLIYDLLQNTGELLFKEAVKGPDSEKKLISAVVVGLGKHGTEMTKSLAWFGQMDGYRIEIHAFDQNPDAKEKFSALCPELMDEKHNNQFDDDGEAQYNIEIHQGVDVESLAFLKEIQQLKVITYLFVDVGEDEKNIRTAIKLRSLLEKEEQKPRIQAVVRNTERKNALEGITNHSGQSYEIDFVGDVKSFYSVGSIIDSEIENEALQRHLKWGEEEDFWKYEYNRRSSIASALHRRMKKNCEIPGIDKAPAERTETERLNLRMMEHRRWNAYMRSEGFTYAEKRNNLAKTHHCLVTYDDLTPEEQAKDDD